MKQCLRITFSMEIPQQFFERVIQKNAQKFGLEGTVQRLSDQEVKIIICGNHEAVDDFIGSFHKDAADMPVEGFQIEPFVRDRDYRGVFRIIE